MPRYQLTYTTTWSTHRHSPEHTAVASAGVPAIIHTTALMHALQTGLARTRVFATRRGPSVRAFATASAELKWLAANDVTAEVGGDANVARLRSVSRDFRSMSPPRLSRPS